MSSSWQIDHPLHDNSELLTIRSSLPLEAARKLTSAEIDQIPLLRGAIRILRFWGLIFENNWRSYFAMSVTTFLNLTQFCWMFSTDDSIDNIIHYAYMMVLWTNTIARAYLMLYHQRKYEKFLAEIIDLYKEILHCGDRYLTDMLQEVNRMGKNATIVNMMLGALSCLCVYSFLFSKKRMLPYGSHIPGLDELQSPLYEILYTYQLAITPLGCILYIPFGSLLVSLMMFAILMCRVLQHRLRGLKEETNDDVIATKLTMCIKYQKTIIRYISVINSLTAYMFLVEFIAFGVLICGLLFIMNIATTPDQFSISVVQITMLFSQILTLYWYAHELSDATLQIADAAYDTNWHVWPKPLQKSVLLLIMRAQKPCTTTIGNIYPMSLEICQSLLNASYSYFNILRQVYD